MFVTSVSRWGSSKATSPSQHRLQEISTVLSTSMTANFNYATYSERSYEAQQTVSISHYFWMTVAPSVTATHYVSVPPEGALRYPEHSRKVTGDITFDETSGTAPQAMSRNPRARVASTSSSSSAGCSGVCSHGRPENFVIAKAVRPHRNLITSCRSVDLGSPSLSHSDTDAHTSSTLVFERRVIESMGASLQADADAVDGDEGITFEATDFDGSLGAGSSSVTHLD
ncbi:hypothetical protein OH76DRAFT_1416829 [Lentinus brumalis]|uniref:Uncharacterized protein n=1 Tax=Lentinus brumalis TaxID=2498619 RepID=A0A371DIE2_9APHY|nr:hypothetical protein OH76DRAFT_1416829 [Polyporus brumalis]